MNSANLLMEFLSMSLIWVIIVGLVVVFIIIMLIVAIFNIDENTKAIRKILENNNGYVEREEAWIYEEKIKKEEPKEEWIYEEKKKEPKEPKESIWNKKIF